MRDTIHFAIQPEDLLYGNDQTRLQPLLLAFATSRHYPKNAEIKTGYLGLMFSLLVIFTLVYVIKQEKKRDRMLMIFTSTGLFGLLLSFGPYMHWGRLTIHKPFPIPLPYLFFYYLAPGFQGFRNSARWEMLFVLCMSISIALVLSKLEESWKKRVKKTIHRFSWYGIYLVLIFGIIAEYHFPMQFLPAPQRKDFPRIYQFLASTDKMTPVIFLPIYNWNSPYALEEIKREYYSLSEFHPMVNGYSGYSPPPWQKFIAQMNTFPDTSTLQEIRNKGVKDIIVNTSEYDRLEASQHSSRSGEQIIEALRQKDSVLLVKQLGDTYVFTFTR